MRDGKRNFTGDPRAETPTTTIMLRALAVSFAMLAVNPGPCAAETTPPAVRYYAITFATSSPPPTRTRRPDHPLVRTPPPRTNFWKRQTRAANWPACRRCAWNESLREAARAHARRMVESERLEHQLSGEPSLLERIAQGSAGDGLKMDRAGENIAIRHLRSGRE